ncbi:hypothetical protein L218DRAFT_249606 [Marasmius fiardii PR-910]|nr:hypothetical protein L218DRAFT_249606 [Marasmius fiardii PR-910]
MKRCSQTIVLLKNEILYCLHHRWSRRTRHRHRLPVVVPSSRWGDHYYFPALVRHPCHWNLRFLCRTNKKTPLRLADLRKHAKLGLMLLASLIQTCFTYPATGLGRIQTVSILDYFFFSFKS